jgi:hypothetical protein
MTILEIIGMIAIVYWFCRAMLPVMEWHEIEQQERKDPT